VLERFFDRALSLRWTRIGGRILPRRNFYDRNNPEQLFTVHNPVGFGQEAVPPRDPFLDLQVAGETNSHNVFLCYAIEGRIPACSIWYEPQPRKHQPEAESDVGSRKAGKQSA
jgi:hypothetical protein